MGTPLLLAAVLFGLLHAPWGVDAGAGAILHPWRRPLTRLPERPVQSVAFTSGTAHLEGWLFRAEPPRRGLVVFLHGISDNRQSGLGVSRRLVPAGFDVLLLDGRAHGRSTGEACTYGYREREDVSRALDAIEAERAILIGHSLGAAIALQAAAVDPRVGGVVAASAFSDLPTIVRDRARFFLLPGWFVEAALRRAGEKGGFPPEEASPVALASRIRVPTLLLHGGADWKTPPEHSERISAALQSPHRLLILPGVGHDEILGDPEAWREIDAFLDDLAPRPAPDPGATSGASS